MDRENTRILFLIPCLINGGAENQTIQQCNSLHSSSWDVYLCSITDSMPLLNQLKIGENRCLFLHGPSLQLDFKSIFYYKGIYRLIRFCKEKRITHLIANLPPGHWYGRLVKFFVPSVKLICYHRSLQYEANPLDSFSKRMFNGIQKALAKKTDNLSICISRAVMENVSRHMYLASPVVLHNTVKDRYEQVSAQASSSSNDFISVVIPGRIHFSKGQLFFLNTYLKLPENIRCKIRVEIVGGGFEGEKDLRNMIKNHGIEDHVHISGFCKNEILLQKIYEAHLVVIPSIHEGFGNIAVESLMLGKTILSSDSGGLKEIIVEGKNGYLFKAGNEEDFTERFKWLIDTFPENLLDSSKVRDDYLSRFSFDAHIEKLSSLIVSCN